LLQRESSFFAGIRQRPSVEASVTSSPDKPLPRPPPRHGRMTVFVSSIPQQSYGDVLREYEFHPSRIVPIQRGESCTKSTMGLLQRRYVRIEKITCIAKESNSLEDVESGLIHSELIILTYFQR
jgi:hypothetical protein